MHKSRPQSAGAVSSPGIERNTNGRRSNPATPLRSQSPRTSPVSASGISPTARSDFWAGGSPLSPTGVSNEMLDAKLTRKRAESDLQLLANRISLLKVEEQKALSKVAQTKQKALELEKTKKRNEASVHMKVRHTTERDAWIQANQQKAQAVRSERQRRLSQSKQLASESKKAAAEDAKQSTRRLAEQVNLGRSATENEKHLRTQENRQRRDSALAARKAKQKEKEALAQQNYLTRKEVENTRKREAEAMIALLEKEEKQLIDRLRKTQELQDSAHRFLQQQL